VSTVNSAIDIADDATARPVECECDRTLAVAAATMSRATNTAVIIGFVMGTSSCPKSSGACTNNKCALSDIERRWAVRRKSERPLPTAFFNCPAPNRQRCSRVHKKDPGSQGALGPSVAGRKPGRPEKRVARGRLRMMDCSFSSYFKEVLIESNLLFRFVPRPLTTAIIASEMPAAMRPYSMAVAPLSSARNFANMRFID
jgi:hypothetical protein